MSRVFFDSSFAADGAAELVDARPVAVGSIKGTFEKFPHLGKALPAMGYSDTQVSELEQAALNAPATIEMRGLLR